jgi:hypothetical protein
MTPRHRLIISVAIVVAFAAQLAPASAANGLAWDAVTKLVTSDASSLQPGSFTSDFQTASQPPPSHGGMFGKLQNAAEGAMASFKNGTAERHYVAGSKTRIDMVALQTATIVDCSARTLTTLDLKAKTYRVTSLDHPSTPGSASGGPSRPEPRPTDDGTKVAIVVTTKSLGPKQIESNNTSGYSADMKMTVTKPGQDPQTSDMTTTGYYTGTPMPSVSCHAPVDSGSASRYGGGGGSGAQMSGSMLSSYATAMSALRDSKGNPRFTVSASGPSLPVGDLSLWDIVSFQGQGSSEGRAFSILMERGNVRSISDSDPIFSVPSDFTQQT